MENYEDVLDVLAKDIEDLRREGTLGTKGGYETKDGRRGSRWLGEHSDPSFVEHVAKGGSYDVHEPRSEQRRGSSWGSKAGPSLAGTMVKALSESTGSAGGVTVPAQVADEIVRLLRAQSVTLRMGARLVPVRKELDVNYLASGATAFWVAENATAPVSEQTFGQSALIKPRDLVVMVPVSDRLLRDAAEVSDLDQALQEDMSQVLSLAADRAFLRGSGAAMEPLGLRNFPGVVVTEIGSGDGDILHWDHLKQEVGALRELNAQDWTSAGWVFNSTTLSGLERLKLSDGRYHGQADQLLEVDPTGVSGRLLGLPFRVSNQIPNDLEVGASTDCSELYLSASWSELWIGQSGEMTVAASGEASYDSGGGVWVSAYQARQTLFRLVWCVDLGLRRPSLFRVLSGARAPATT